jgi:release factor glutamine methyltransferase
VTTPASRDPSAPPEPRTAPWTILEVLKWITGRFTERGLPTPRLDAELLAAHALSLPRLALYTQFDRPLATAELAALRDLVRRRQGGEPVAYLTGKKEFWSLDLEVDRRVLIPRPDTETAVEAALAIIPGDADPAWRVADVGTGSGAIALAIKKERPQAVVLAVDTSEDALAVARANGARLGLVVDWRLGDLLAPLAGEPPLDVLVANLPYVPTAELPGLQPEVRSEPLLALDGGADGLDVIRRLIAGVAPVLRAEGWLLLELGLGQAAAVEDLCRTAGMVEVSARRDHAGVPRVVQARRAPGAARA